MMMTMVGMMMMMMGMMMMMMSMMTMMMGMMMMKTCGGGVPRADPAEIPRLESKVRQPVEPPSGSPLHSEPDRLSVLSDPGGEIKLNLWVIFFGVNDLNMIVDISQLSRICVSCLCLDSGVCVWRSGCESVSVSVCLCVSVCGVQGVSSVVVVLVNREIRGQSPNP